MAPTNEAKRIALCLILFLTMLGVTLASAATEDNYKNETNLLPQIYESTHAENGYKATIIINPYTTGIYTKESNFNLDLTVSPHEIGGAFTENSYQLDLIPEKAFPAIPSLAVASVITSKTIVGQGYNITIETTIKNHGFSFETFTITTCANTTIIETQVITLPSKDSTTITFAWNTTGVAYGNYTISCTVTTVPGEVDTADNILIDGTVLVTIAGDVDGDCDVDGFDLTRMCGVYGSTSADPEWDDPCDLNGDGIIDGFDLTPACGNYGQTI